MDLDDDAHRPPAHRGPEAGAGTHAGDGRNPRIALPVRRRAFLGRTPSGVPNSVRIVVVHDDRVVVHVGGALDLHLVGVLREVLLDAVTAHFTDIVVVLTGVTFIDSTGLGVLVGAHKRARSHDGRLLLVVDQESVLKTIRITALHRVFALYPTLDAALDA